MQQIIEVIQLWIGNYGFFGVLGAGIIEELFSPIPSSLVQGFAGTVLFTGKALTIENLLIFTLTIPVASAIGVTIGSLPYVWATKKWGLKIIDRYGSYISVSRKDIEALTRRMEQVKWDELLFVGLRAFPLIPNVTLAIYAGLIAMPLSKYILLSSVGVFFRGIIIGGIGWYAGNQLSTISEGISVLETIGLFIIVFGIIGWYVYKKKNRK